MYPYNIPRNRLLYLITSTPSTGVGLLLLSWAEGTCSAISKGYIDAVIYGNGLELHTNYKD